MLSREDMEGLAYVYKIPADAVAAVGRSTNGLPYLRELQKMNIFSSSNLRGLREVLINIERCDLIKMIEEYEQERDSQPARRVRYTRPQEECTRLDISYAQAKKTEDELVDIQRELSAFCSKLGSTNTAIGLMQFCTGLSRRLKRMKDDCNQYTTIPLHDMINQTYLQTAHEEKGATTHISK